jgi:NTE family protein
MPRPTKKTRPTSPQTVLVFQGGGALGAYQAGVFEALCEKGGIEPDWIVGTSIGAINGALIAGNAPEHRLARLKEFWGRVAQRGLAVGGVPGLPGVMQPWLGALQNWQTLATLMLGVPGFFKPRLPTPWDLSGKLPLDQLSFYDTAPLRDTLLELIDFDRLANGPMRLTLSAVNIQTGLQALFDNRKQAITPEHIMASGALPPGFAPVLIDGQPYWDGGVYSNTPLDVVLDDAERRDALCFMVDLWDASEAAPSTLAQALARLKDIQYASRIEEHLDDHERMQNLRRAVRLLGRHLQPDVATTPEVKRLLALGCDSSIDVVHLVMKAMPGEDSWRDIDFSTATLDARWRAGAHDGRRVLAHPSWLKPPADHLGMRVHSLPQEA